MKSPLNVKGQKVKMKVYLNPEQIENISNKRNREKKEKTERKVKEKIADTTIRAHQERNEEKTIITLGNVMEAIQTIRNGTVS